MQTDFEEDLTTGEEVQHDVNYALKTLKRIAWRLGRKSATHPHKRDSYIDELKSDAEDFKARYPSITEFDRELFIHYRQGVLSAKIPSDAPEKALEAAYWFRDNISTEFRHIEGCQRLTKSKNFIFLYFIAYALGTWYEIFPFSSHRMASIGKQYFGKFSTSTVSDFLKWAIEFGFLECVREGIPYHHSTSGKWSADDSLSGVAATYRLADKFTPIKAFGMSWNLHDGGVTYIDHVEEMRQRFSKEKASHDRLLENVTRQHP